jgi:multiple sugar transport system substrate-binding protein
MSRCTRLGSIGTLVAVALLSAACGSGSSGHAAGSASAASGTAAGGGSTTTHITFWNSFTASDRPAVEALVAKFNATQQSVKVDMTIMPADVLGQKLLPAYAAHKGPTITTLDASQVPEFASKGAIAAVDDVYGSGGLDASILPAASLAATKWNGKQYGVPFAATDTMLYYNKTLFKAAGIASPPTTMAELASDAVKLTKYNSATPSKSQFGFIIPDHAAPATWAILLWDDGGGVVSDDGKTSTLGSAGSIKAVDYWAGLIKNQHISPAGLAGTDTDTLFSSGRAAMYINGPWASAGFTQAKVDFGVVPVPKGNVAQTSDAISVNMHLDAAASSSQKAAAETFFKYWNTAETQTYWATHSAYPPNLSTIPSSALASNPVSQEFQKGVGGRFYLGGLTQATQIDTEYVTPAIQQITEGKGTAGDLLPKVAKQIEPLLGQ